MKKNKADDHIIHFVRSTTAVILMLNI